MKRSTLTIAALYACACGDSDGASVLDPSAFTVRDSAGVEIVESTRPSLPEAQWWRLSSDPLFVIHASDGSEENRLLDPTSIDVDARGRIIIGDGYQAGWHAVFVYDSVGRFLRQVGGEGEGPGEFGQLWWASAYRGDSIAAFDMARDRVSIFGPDGGFTRQLEVPRIPVPRHATGAGTFVPGLDAAYGDGHFLAYPMGTTDISSGPGPVWMRHDLVRLAPDGESWEVLGDFEIMQQHWDGSRQELLWFAPTAVTAVGVGELYHGRGETFEIRRYDHTGRPTRVIRRGYEPRPVTDDLRALAEAWYLDRVSSSPEANDQVLERLRSQMAAARYAEVLPPYSSMLLDDAGNLWVERFRWLTPNEAPLEDRTTWSVFDARGVWTLDVEMPPGYILRNVTGDRAYGFVADELGVLEAHVYGLERGGS